MMDEDFDIRQERFSQGEKDFENALRPLSFSDFSGQKKVVENLEVFVEAAKYRGEPLDHTLLHGPPGLGKTTLSNIIANELGVGFKITSGPVLDKPGDLAGILTSPATVGVPRRSSSLLERTILTNQTGSYCSSFGLSRTVGGLPFPCAQRHSGGFR